MCQLQPPSPIFWSPQHPALLGWAHRSATLAWHAHCWPRLPQVLAPAWLPTWSRHTPSPRRPSAVSPAAWLRGHPLCRVPRRRLSNWCGGAEARERKWSRQDRGPPFRKPQFPYLLAGPNEDFSDMSYERQTLGLENSHTHRTQVMWRCASGPSGAIGCGGACGKGQGSGAT